jgi:ectoine hydroxylase-related dioxygenase (phytanoyl-CoA dioxygenase family)
MLDMQKDQIQSQEPELWREQFNDQGYLVVEDAVNEITITGLRDALKRVEQVVKNESLPAHLRRHVRLESERTRGQRLGRIYSDAISNIMELPLFGDEFAQFILYPRLLDILEILFASSEFSFHNYKANDKMPGNNAHFAWHRDLPYLKHTTPNLITCMVCLDPMTRESGATVVCLSSHHIPHEQVRPEDVDIPLEEVPGNRVVVECPAGAALLFHATLVHGGGPNTSVSKRRNLISIWAGSETYPTTNHRYAFEFIMPRSKELMRQKQIQQTFHNIRP